MLAQGKTWTKQTVFIFWWFYLLHTGLVSMISKSWASVNTILYVKKYFLWSHRWTVIGFPHKIQQQIESTELALQADEEHFQKNLLSDQTTFQDRLDTLNMVIAGFAAHTDINRAHEVANDVRRITKQLKECQTLASTYNNRERLFGLPVTSVCVSFFSLTYRWWRTLFSLNFYSFLRRLILAKGIPCICFTVLSYDSSWKIGFNCPIQNLESINWNATRILTQLAVCVSVSVNPYGTAHLWYTSTKIGRIFAKFVFMQRKENSLPQPERARQN